MPDCEMEQLCWLGMIIMFVNRVINGSVVDDDVQENVHLGEFSTGKTVTMCKNR